MVKIYHFILDHRVGGPHVYVSTMARVFHDRVEAEVFTTGRGPLTQRTLLNLRHLWAPLYGLEVLINNLYLVLLVALRRILRQGSIFHVHGSANLAPILAARLSGIPLVWHIHETSPNLRIFVNLGKLIIRGANHSVAVVARKSSEVYKLYPVEFLPASVDPSFWSRRALGNEVNQPMGWQERDWISSRSFFRLLVVGNLNPLKGLDVLLNALAKLDGPWHLQIVGAELETHKGYAEMMRLQAQQLMAERSSVRVDFLGWRGRETIRALLGTCDLFVLPSRSEACPIALLEAIAMRCSCVAADVGDVGAMLEDYPMARLFTSGRSEDCFNALLEMRTLSSGHVRCDEEVINQGAWELCSVANKTLELYKRLMKIEALTR